MSIPFFLSFLLFYCTDSKLSILPNLSWLFLLSLTLFIFLLLIQISLFIQVNILIPFPLQLDISASSTLPADSETTVTHSPGPVSILPSESELILPSKSESIILCESDSISSILLAHHLHLTTSAILSSLFRVMILIHKTQLLLKIVHKQTPTSIATVLITMISNSPLKTTIIPHFYCRVGLEACNSMASIFFSRIKEFFQTTFHRK